MRVDRLTLRNFRNYTEFAEPFSPSRNLILGRNGQGKTNLLEALYLLSHSRSNRTSSDRELIRRGADFAVVLAETAYAHGGHHKLEVQLSITPEDRLKTVMKADGAPLRNRSGLLGFLPAVSFFLPDLLMVRGTPEDRRRWLDAAIVQYDKRHLQYLTDFHRIRQQKTQLLKKMTYPWNPSHLDVWNEQFARAGAQVMHSRIQYLALIQDWAQIKYLELADSQETLTLTYQSALFETDGNREFSPTLAAEFSQENLEAMLAEGLQRRAEDELRRQTCLVGPHRDDVQFWLNQLPAPSYGSQGQQRSIVLALKLTELKLLTSKLGEPPILLLDDVMAELDPTRQRLLMEHVNPESQVFLTTTHLDREWKDLLPMFTTGDIRVFEVSQGTVQVETRSIS